MDNRPPDRPARTVGNGPPGPRARTYHSAANVFTRRTGIPVDGVPPPAPVFAPLPHPGLYVQPIVVPAHQRSHDGLTRSGLHQRNITSEGVYVGSGAGPAGPAAASPSYHALPVAMGGGLAEAGPAAAPAQPADDARAGSPSLVDPAWNAGGEAQDVGEESERLADEAYAERRRQELRILLDEIRYGDHIPTPDERRAERLRRLQAHDRSVRGLPPSKRSRRRDEL